MLAGWWQLSRSAKLLPHLRRRPSSFLFIPGYVFVSWIMAIIKLQALLTIRRQRWLTRQVAVENGQVVRTAGADPAQAPTTAPGMAVAPQGVPVPVGGPGLLRTCRSARRRRAAHQLRTGHDAGQAQGHRAASGPADGAARPVQARPRPYVVDQPTSPVNAVVPRQATGSGPVPIAPPRRPAGRRAGARGVANPAAPAAVSRKGVA